MSHDFGDIVLVRFPFTDQRGAKRRPAVVISTLEYHLNRPDVILAAVTSRLPNSQDELDLPIRYWDVGSGQGIGSQADCFHRRANDHNPQAGQAR